MECKRYVRACVWLHFLTRHARLRFHPCSREHACLQEDEEDGQGEAMESQEQGRTPVEDHVEVYQSLVTAYDGHLASASEPSKVTLGRSIY